MAARTPAASSPGVARSMRANRRTDTKPERRLRSALHQRGLRFRKDLRLNAGGRKVRPDIVFTRRRVAVFVDGCFWHRCPIHGRWPQRNASYWNEKFGRNVARDQADTLALEGAGWSVLRIWEHVSTTEAADLIESSVNPVPH
jgi:DNA mismatch endonuclease (patch repair protein)